MMEFFEYLKIFLIALLIFAVILGLAYWLAMVYMENERARSAEAWNGGICPDCGAEWERYGSQKERGGPIIHFWECPDCGKLIHTYEFDIAEGTGEERRKLKGKEG